MELIIGVGIVMIVVGTIAALYLNKQMKATHGKESK
jgi:hypothetical protein